MADLWVELALVAVLIVLNGALAGAEIALVSLRPHQLEHLAMQGRRGRALARLAGDPNRFLATIQIGITLAGFLASATAAVSLSEPLTEPLGFLGSLAEPVAVISVTLVLSFLTLVLGELAPKRIAMQRVEGWALRSARPLDGLARLTRPIVWLLGWSSDLVVRLAGLDPDETRGEITEEELRSMVAAQEGLSPDQRAMLEGTFELTERTLREILVPRQRVVVLRSDTTVAAGLAILVGAGRARAPVVGDDQDEVVGMVHLRDLVGPDGPLEPHVRPVVFLPESVTVLDALRRLRAEREQLAVVVNEFGAFEGIVTMEDLLEEIVGEIYDETDPHVRLVERDPDGTLTLPGAFPVHDLDEVGVELPPGDYATVAGLVLEELGRVPDGPGDEVVLDGWRIEVCAVERRAITKVRLHPLPLAEPEESDEG